MEGDDWFWEVNGARRGPLTLEQMKELVKSGAIRRQTRVWPPGAAADRPATAGDFLEQLATLPKGGNELAYVLPINRNGWAIAAGYLGLFSILPLVSYVGLLVSLIAARSLRRNPTQLGWGRVITGLVISVPMSILYTVLLVKALTLP